MEISKENSLTSIKVEQDSLNEITRRDCVRRVCTWGCSSRNNPRQHTANWDMQCSMLACLLGLHGCHQGAWSATLWKVRLSYWATLATKRKSPNTEDILSPVTKEIQIYYCGQTQILSLQPEELAKHSTSCWVSVQYYLHYGYHKHCEDNLHSPARSETIPLQPEELNEQ